KPPLFPSLYTDLCVLSRHGLTASGLRACSVMQRPPKALHIAGMPIDAGSAPRGMEAIAQRRRGIAHPAAALSAPALLPPVRPADAPAPASACDSTRSARRFSAARVGRPAPAQPART